MNKRGFAEGLSWFFAILVTSLILFLFFMAANFFFSGVKENRGDIYLGDFYKKDSLRQIILMEDYDHNEVYNNFSYQLYNADLSFLVSSDLVLFLDSISKNIFSKTNSGIYSGTIRFSFGPKFIDWSPMSLTSGFHTGSSGNSQLVSELAKQQVTYADNWEYYFEKESFLIPNYRLYRVYFLTEGRGFVRFGSSEILRSHEK